MRVVPKARKKKSAGGTQKEERRRRAGKEARVIQALFILPGLTVPARPPGRLRVPCLPCAGSYTDFDRSNAYFGCRADGKFGEEEEWRC
jgi:hypothetical protein